MSDKGDKKAVRSDERGQGVDKDPQEEKTRAEKVTTKDLKGKKVDADPSKQSGQPG